MKNQKNRIHSKFLTFAACILLGHSALAQTSAFTYQGRLTDGGAAANGSYDVTFALYDAVAGGNLSGVIVTNVGVTVSNGVFTTLVDLGPAPFAGNDLWLEIGVSTNGAGTFSTIAPRQMITPSPYALFAQAAGTANNIASSSISPPQLNTAGAPISGQVLAYNGSQLVWEDPVVASGIAGGWSLTGNLGTLAGSNFLGTLDSQPFEIRVGGGRALRLEPNSSGAPNVIGGASVNYVSNGIVGATIAGGGAASYVGLAYSNSITASFAAIGGGAKNNAGGSEAFVGGGYQNNASGYISTIGGGAYNIANGAEAFVGGGAYDEATNYSFVGGGYENNANGVGSAIAGGGYDGSTASGNTASGEVSFIGGGLGNAIAVAGYATTVAGGFDNIASGRTAFIGGGQANTADGTDHFDINQFLFLEGGSTVAGGYGNLSSATCAAIPGGAYNTAAGDFSFAGGYHAAADTFGSFVWADGSSASAFTSTANNQFLIRSTGGVGIGTSQTPPGGLRVASGGFAVTGASSPNYPGSAGVFIEKTSGGGAVFAFDYNAVAPLSLALNSPGGNVGIGTLTPQATLDVNGTTRTHSLNVTGGSDLAEPFRMGSRVIEKGSVVAIDEEHPGELKLTSKEYDPGVAGIVSGANGINPGIALHQEGALDGGQNVALSGRVYVMADVSNGPIKPGDCLTSSSTPGHAMKVTDHVRAQGAIIGKAMTSLDSGAGMVLVLVTLQ